MFSKIFFVSRYKVGRFLCRQLKNSILILDSFLSIDYFQLVYIEINFSYFTHSIQYLEETKITLSMKV
jgi:hypothetical protein